MIRGVKLESLTSMVRRGSACVIIFPRGFWILAPAPHETAGTTKVSLRRKKSSIEVRAYEWLLLIYNDNMLPRKHTLEVTIWNVKLGGNNPIVIQSMTNTPTADVAATVAQIKELADAGSELVRITVDTEESAQAAPEIVKQLHILWCDVPIIGDFHFNGHLLLEKYPEMAKALSKYRINPGNTWKDNNFKKFIELAVKYQKPVRIGINWWSLDKKLLDKNMEKNAKKPSWLAGRPDPKTPREVFVDSLVQSCVLSINKAQKYGLAKNMIVISIKSSDVQDVIAATEKLSNKTGCPLHLWLTEAGGSTKWLVASTAALWILLQQWIGDTIRISLTPEPGKPRSLEVQACKYLLQSMGFRYFQPLITSCPGCGRTGSTAFQKLAKQVSDEVQKRMPERKKKYPAMAGKPGCERIRIAIMWCVVNGVGEASHADIGIFFPGNAENPQIPVYVKWKMFKVLEWENVFEQFMEIVEKYFQDLKM